MIPNDVFHYTNKEASLEHILFERKIRFGQIGFTNDPKETKEWSIPLVYDKTLEPKDIVAVQSNITNKAHDIGTQEWKVLCVSQHHPNYPTRQESPFMRGDCRPRMWAQYGENHKGVCLKFSGPKLGEQLKKELGEKCRIYQGSIIYDDIRSIVAPLINLNTIDKLGLEEGIREYFFEYYEHFFLSKPRDWESEYEYRWIIHSPFRNPEFVSIENVIEGVIVGVDFPKVYEPSLIELCKDLNIPVGRVNWFNGMPRVDLECIYKP